MSNRETSRIGLEGLENRQMLAAHPLGISQVAWNGGAQLVINGTNASDNISVSPVAGGLQIANGTWTRTVLGSFKTIVINAGKGNDRVTIDPAISTSAFIYGGIGDDTLAGGSGDDKLYGQGGIDNLSGGAGDDILVNIGDSRLDKSAGGAGFDSFWSDAAAGEQIADASSDEVLGGAIHRVNGFQTYQTTRRGVARLNRVGLDLNGGDLADPGLDTTAARYRNFSRNPLFADAGPAIDDVEQGYVGDCWFLATLGSIARTNANAIRQSVAELGDGTYAVQFALANGAKAYVRVDGDLAVASWGGMQYAGLGAQNSLWVAIMEKAYACFRNNGVANYAQLSGGWMDEAFADLGYRSSTQWDADSGDALLGDIEQELADGKAVTIAIRAAANGAPLIGSHAYTVVRVERDAEGRRVLVVRNPWGIDGAGKDGSDDGYVKVTAQQAIASFWAVISAVVD